MPTDNDIRAALLELADESPGIDRLLTALPGRRTVAHAPRRALLALGPAVAVMAVLGLVVALVLIIRPDRNGPVTHELPTGPRSAACSAPVATPLTTFGVSGGLRTLSAASCANFRSQQVKLGAVTGFVTLYGKGAVTADLFSNLTSVTGSGIEGYTGDLPADPSTQCSGASLFDLGIGGTLPSCGQRVLVWEYDSDRWGIVQIAGATTPFLMRVAADVDAGVQTPFGFPARLTALPPGLGLSQVATSVDSAAHATMLNLGRQAVWSLRFAEPKKSCRRLCDPVLRVDVTSIRGTRSSPGRPLMINGFRAYLETGLADGRTQLTTRRGSCLLTVLGAAAVSTADIVRTARGAQVVADCARPSTWPSVAEAIGH